MFEEKPVKKAIRGCLLYDHTTDRHFFRVYHKTPDGQHIKNENGGPTFDDYDLRAEDIDIVLMPDDGISLFKTRNGGQLNWSSETLGHKVAPGEPRYRSIIKDHKMVKGPDGKHLVQKGHYGEDLEFIPDPDGTPS